MNPANASAPSICILGGGAVVTELYLPALRLLGWERGVHVVDPSPALAAKYAAWAGVTFHQAGFTEYLQSLLPTATFDFVIVALPNFLHAAAVTQALLKGLPVLCEKPLTLTEHSSRELGTLAAKTGTLLGVGMVRRHLPYVTAMREALQGNLIGKPLSLDIQHGSAFAWASVSGAFFRKESGGVLADMGVHYLDLAMALTGSLQPVRYRDDACGGIEANVDYQLVSESGAQVRIVLSRTHTLGNTIVLKGETGTLTAQVDRYDGCDWRSTTHPGLVARLTASSAFHDPRWPLDFISCFAEQFWRFQQAVIHSSPPTADASAAASTARLIEWGYANGDSTTLGLPAFPPTTQGQRPKLAPAPVVVTGGTGFIGTHLIERLTELGLDDMRVPVRNFQTCAEVARFPVRLSHQSLLDKEQLRSLCKGARHVFHLAYGREQADSAAITIEGTRNVVEAAIAEGVECVVVLSTMYVFGHPATAELVDESWPYAPAGGFYGSTKVKMEKWCLQRAKSAGNTRIVVLNPSCVYGPGGKTYSMLPLQLCNAGTFGWIEEGKGIANFTYISNLIDCIVLAATVPAAHGQRFLVTDGSCSWKDFLQPVLGDKSAACRSWTLKQLRGNRSTRKRTLKELVRHLSNDYVLLEIINGIPWLRAIKQKLLSASPRLRNQLTQTREEPVAAPAPVAADAVAAKIPPVWLADLFGPTVTHFSAQKAQRILGWQPLVTPAAGHERTREWLRALRLLP